MGWTAGRAMRREDPRRSLSRASGIDASLPVPRPPVSLPFSSLCPLCVPLSCRVEGRSRPGFQIRFPMQPASSRNPMETSQKRPATRETRPGPLTAWDRRDVRLLLGATALVCGAAGRRLKQAEPLRPHSAPLARQQRAIRPLSSVIWTAQSTRGDAFAPKVNSGDAWVPGDQAAKPAALSRPHPLPPDISSRTPTGGKV